MKKKYVIIGASVRSIGMFVLPIKDELSDYVDIVGIYDPNYLRTDALKKITGLTCVSYTDFDQMITDQKPDTGIIVSADYTHHEYVIKCLEAGLDVICEKPLTIDAEKCNAILNAEKRTGRKVTVTFNLRFTPYASAIKKALNDGLIGDVLCVDFEWFLDTSHGADYFRRWHRKKEYSGGLLVHKATHHFDLINWWIGEEPIDVMAYGERRFYGPTRKERGKRCLGCAYKESCEFYLDIEYPGNVSGIDALYKKMYRDCESVDGYCRDSCVFSDEIDIEDTMSVNVKYSKGALLSYSLVAYSPYEGYKVSINGTKGRLEAAEFMSGPRASETALNLDIYKRSGEKVQLVIPKANGQHGGGDEKLRKTLFITDDIPDPLGQQANSFAGALSILIGIAANKSIKTGKNIKISNLVPLNNYRK